jgi:hypothetical protein
MVLEAKYGHLEIKVPPGFYTINAVWDYWIDFNDVIHGNHFTHNAIVLAECEKTKCVRFFTPQAHVCGVIFLAVRDMVKQDIVPRELAKKLDEVVEETLRHIPLPPKRFEMGLLKELKQKERERGKER